MMKDPDTLHDAIGDKTVADILDEDERDAVADLRNKKTRELCGEWFEYGEYLQVEVDTDAKTCTVLTVKP